MAGIVYFHGDVVLFWENIDFFRHFVVYLRENVEKLTSPPFSLSD
jgi:hypothetical protein